MESKPRFSIIVPVYGVEKFLVQCIESILSQTFTDFELILVDDGGTDQCPVICDEYVSRDSRVFVIHKANGGQTSARIAGAEKACGEYIACIDGDDYIDSRYLQCFSECIDTYHADIICSGSIWWTNENLQQYHFVSGADGFYDRKRLESEIFPWLIEDASGRYFSNSVWAKVFKRDLFLSNQRKVNPGIKIGEDAVCVKSCIIESDSLFVISDCLYFYRQNPQSITNSKKCFSWDGPQYIAELYFENEKFSNVSFKEQIYRNCVHNVFNVAVSRFYQPVSRTVVFNEIRRELKRPVFDESIKNAYFTFGSKGWIALLSLRFKWLFVIYLFSRIK